MTGEFSDNNIDVFEALMYEDHVDIIVRMLRLAESSAALGGILVKDSDVYIGDLITVTKYMEKADRICSELTSLNALEFTITVSFVHLQDIPAQWVFAIQEFVNYVMDKLTESATAFKTHAGEDITNDSRFLNLRMNIIETCDDLLDMIERRKNELNKLMSEVRERFE